MKNLIAIVTAACFVFVAGLNAAKPQDQPKGNSKKAAPKAQTAPKPHAAPQVQAAPKQHAAPKTDSPKQRRKAPAAPPATDVTTAQPKNVKPSKAPKLEKSTTPTTTTTDATAPVNPADKNARATTPKTTKLDPAAIKKIQAQHTNFKAKPVATVASAQFNPNYRIEAAQNWSGPQYEIFRSYQPQWHDQAWYGSRYGANLRLIGGGWYFWEGGYWFPAWGYDESAAYYPYDGPIYVGSNPRPFDQVVADVQAVLQEQGYYRGEVDGLVGPLTREALAAYQSATGLPPTAAIDAPTLDSLGLT